MTKTEPRKQGYNPAVHSALPYVSKHHKVLLDRIALAKSWTKRVTAEKAIEQLAELHGIAD